MVHFLWQFQHFSKAIFQISLNPCKSLLLDINYLTVINLSSALEFYLDFDNAFFVHPSYMKIKPKEGYANQQKAVLPLCLNLSRAFWLPVLSSPVFATLLAWQKLQNLQGYSVILHSYIQIRTEALSKSWDRDCPMKYPAGSVGLTGNYWYIFLRVVYQTAVHLLNEDNI